MRGKWAAKILLFMALALALAKDAFMAAIDAMPSWVIEGLLAAFMGTANGSEFGELKSITSWWSRGMARLKPLSVVDGAPNPCALFPVLLLLLVKGVLRIEDMATPLPFPMLQRLVLVLLSRSGTDKAQKCVISEERGNQTEGGKGK
jgi:hypothetical protein